MRKHVPDGLSLLGVVMSFVGAFSPEQILSIVGPILTLVVHLLTRRQMHSDKSDARSEAFWHNRAEELAEKLWAERKRTRDLRQEIERLAYRMVSEPTPTIPPSKGDDD